MLSVLMEILETLFPAVIAAAIGLGLAYGMDKLFGEED